MEYDRLTIEVPQHGTESDIFNSVTFYTVPGVGLLSGDRAQCSDDSFCSDPFCSRGTISAALAAATDFFGEKDDCSND